MRFGWDWMVLGGTSGHQIREELQTPKMIIGQSRNKVEQTGRAGSFYRKDWKGFHQKDAIYCLNPPTELLETRQKSGFRDIFTVLTSFIESSL